MVLLFVVYKNSLWSSLLTDYSFFSEGIACFWHLQFLGITTTTLDLLSQLYASPFQELLVWIPTMTHFLFSQVFLWNLDGCSYDSILQAKSASVGWCYGLLPAQAVVTPPQTTAAVISGCIDIWSQGIHLPKYPLVNGVLWNTPMKQILLYPWEWSGWGLGQFLRFLQDIFSVVPAKSSS